MHRWIVAECPRLLRIGTDWRVAPYKPFASPFIAENRQRRLWESDRSRTIGDITVDGRRADEGRNRYRNQP